ncbi:hypothetical protein MMSR116_06345 [Methylobacterium mesophilicum SR1.6/6]|uniref:DUF6894 domain-containing protein n=1 Tax=Methylobacterium mesophilicum SR1.6/6 TaxID=908290 RepID=A0A6B9FIG7_9HYPH|nr:hypothetical protein [Methylobacterium mesophilicum]QGY01566.1 hypothetical protein MMSR116_06345 [Methylobacterium mesophilicum SR1.6/6]
MPRYHFNVHDGVDVPDPTGADFADWQTARVEAIRRVGVIFKDEPQRIALGEDWRMEVTDETGLILFRLDFSSSEAPVLAGAGHSPLEQT